MCTCKTGWTRRIQPQTLPTEREIEREKGEKRVREISKRRGIH